MKIYLVVIFFLLICLKSSSQVVNVLDSDFREEIDFFIANYDSYQFYYKKCKIPHQIKKNITKISGRRFRIANPGNNYQANDVKRLFMPDKRMVYFAVNKEYIILVYDRSGRAHSRYMHIWNQNNKNRFCEFFIPYYEKKEDLTNWLSKSKIRLTVY